MQRLLFLILLLIITPPALSDNLDDLAELSRGWAAFNRGDTASAIKTWLPLAEQGNKAGQYNLGKIYAKGEGVAQDFKAALKWYTLAAEQGHTEAQGNLAMLYLEGKGTPEDDVMAYMLFNIAAANGSRRALEVRDLIVQFMTPEKIAQEHAMAREWLAKHQQ